MSSVHQGFQETGQSEAGSDAAFRWLDRADGHPLIRLLKQRMLEACPVAAGYQVLDVGCGLGHEARRLAELAGPAGRVVGIDANPAMIDEARRRASGASTPVTFDVGDAHALALDAAVPHPWIGRQLFGLFKRAGLLDVRVVPHAVCVSGEAGLAVYQQLNRGTIDQARQAGQLSAGEVATWWAALEQAAEAGTFFSAALGFIAVGGKA